MGYLICENCGGYYELQPEEHPDDFEKCQCGGKLQYTEHLKFETELPSIESLENESNDSGASHTSDSEKSRPMKMPSTLKVRKPLIIGIIAVVALLFKLHVFNYLIFYIMRYTSHSYSSWIYLIVIMIVSFLSIIVRKYMN